MTGLKPFDRSCRVRGGALLALLALVLLATGIARPGHAAAADRTTYHKWSVIAIEETKHKYPKAALVDYSHIGRTHVGDGLSEERFKLWLREGSREFGVYATVRFRDAEDRLIAITLRESRT
ncbi:DUF3889 domain-containing protein [Cohnella sp. 56]|uniref:DUF3889 domain-containing protein n=1 Tax=Cohnella sp. 56 TaxID=3113722 RepID=UPI0030E77B03